MLIKFFYRAHAAIDTTKIKKRDEGKTSTSCPQTTMRYRNANKEICIIILSPVLDHQIIVSCVFHMQVYFKN